jgi:aminodeoxyfutalosine deaminase
MPSTITPYRARWIIPGDGRPIEHGVLLVSDGRVVNVQPQWSQPCVDLGDVAIIPGLVNCHAHLEFSLLDRPIEPYRPFTSWLEQVISQRQSAADAVSTAIQRGLQESLLSGVTLLGDIATTGWSFSDYTPEVMTPDVVVFQELLGLTETRVTEQQTRARTHVETATNSDRLHTGLSPHAPYSTHPELFQTALELGQSSAGLIAVHLAESREELELLAEARGPLREFLAARNLWRPELFGQRRPADWIAALHDLPRGLVIHGNYLTTAELAALGRAPHLTLVYCPRTHAAFEHPPHPWRHLVEIGGSVALGTDGRSSNPDLSLWNELQFLAAMHPDVPHTSLLKLATVNGARALGLTRTHGTLTPGKWANAAMIQITNVDHFDPVRHLLAPSQAVINTLHRGAWCTPISGVQDSREPR